MNEKIKEQIIDTIRATNYCIFRKTFHDVPYCSFKVPIECGYQSDTMIKFQKQLAHGRIVKIKEHYMCDLGGYK